MTAYKCQKI